MKTNSFSVPTLAEASPHFADQVKRRDDMHASLSAAERESTTLRARLDTSNVTEADGARATRVAALIGDGITSDKPNAALDRSRLAELDRNIADMKSAIIELDKRVRAARAAASATICAQAELEHRLRVSAICGKLIELHAAVADYATLADEINANDIVWLGLVPSHANFVGRPNDKDGAIGVYLWQAVRNGNFESKNVPAALS